MRAIHSLLCAFGCASLAFVQSNFAGDASLDPSFRSALNGRASTLTLQGDGKVLVSGSFTNNGGTNLIRLLPNGSLDESFNAITEVAPGTPQMPVSKVTVQADGKILIAGGFSRVNGLVRSNIARLNPDGALDKGFNLILHDESGLGHVSEMVEQPDGKILLGGSFSTVNQVARKSFARLNPDGVLDTSFTPFSHITNELVGVYGFALQTDGKILVYGRFVTTRDIYRHYLLRLNPDGSVDSTFAANTNQEVELLVLLPDGKILIGGDFEQVDGVKRVGLARLLSDGALDPNFAPVGDYGAANAILPFPDGTMLVGGGFEERHRIGGVPPNPPIGFRYPATGLVRLDAEGTLDRNFNSDGEFSLKSVWDIDLQTDGKVLVVGHFETAAGSVEGGVARLEPLKNDLSACCVTIENSFLRFNIISHGSRTGLIEVSTNLVNWDAVQSVQLSAGIAAQFHDTNVAAFPRRFYRISTQP